MIDYKLSTSNFVICDKMSSPMDNSSDFPDWLEQQLKKRDWSQADLANHAGINRQVISNYINRKRMNPDANVLKSIAKAFQMPIEEIYKAAGLLVNSPDDDPLIKTITYLYEKLREPESKQRALDYLELLIEQEKRGEKSIDANPSPHSQPKPQRQT